MPRERLKVTVTRKLPAPVETRLSELFEVRLNDSDQPMSEAALAEAGFRKVQDNPLNAEGTRYQVWLP